METSKIFSRATNPEQYDLEDISWQSEAGTESTRNFFFWEYLKKYLPEFKDKNVLDIGSGNGWLLEEAKNAGAKTVLGIEPSVKNREISSKLHPNIEVLPNTLENFSASGKNFDMVMSIMSLPHMKNLKASFSKIESLLNENGQLIAMVPDFDYFQIPRHDYKVETASINPNEYVVSITRPSGTIADIVRKNQLYLEAAKEAKLTLTEQVPMTPTKEYIERAPKFALYKDKAICQVFCFKKTH